MFSPQFSTFPVCSQHNHQALPVCLPPIFQDVSQRPLHALHQSCWSYTMPRDQRPLLRERSFVCVQTRSPDDDQPGSIHVTKGELVTGSETFIIVFTVARYLLPERRNVHDPLLLLLTAGVYSLDLKPQRLTRMLIPSRFIMHIIVFQLFNTFLCLFIVTCKNSLIVSC